MRILSFLFLLVPFIAFGQFPTNYTPTYDEIIFHYKALSLDHPESARLDTLGKTDAGLPLHYFIINANGNFQPDTSDQNLVCLIINGIHPGEACGINASILFASDLLMDPPEGVTYVIIPVYNVGGALNRNSTSRANQIGPESYGFRGNAKNLDLNRDFMKCDSKNALSFTSLFQRWKPHILIDTHTTNGADYPLAITLLSTFPEKLHSMQALFLKRELEPALYEGMRQSGEPMIPYVYLKGERPDDGLKAFTDLPRYSTGYAAQFNTLGFMTEAHMFKPFDRRVEATEKFLHTLDSVIASKKDVILKLKEIADRQTSELKEIATKWELSETVDSILFQGYSAEHVPSLITPGAERLAYDRTQPYEKSIAYYGDHRPTGNFRVPKYYIIPQAWEDAIIRLEANNIEFKRFSSDTTIQVIALYASYYETSEQPYEGHYFHKNTGPTEALVTLTFRKGDYLIPGHQRGAKYLAHALDPKSPDSFFNWNFFDPILNQKEYYSSYAFESTAQALLERDSQLRRSFEQEKATNQAFAKNRKAQLEYIYNNSVWHEGSHLRIPVYYIRE